MMSSIEAPSKPWRLNKRRALRMMRVLVVWRCSGRYGIARSVGSEHTARSQYVLEHVFFAWLLCARGGKAVPRSRGQRLGSRRPTLRRPGATLAAVHLQHDRRGIHG